MFRLTNVLTPLVIIASSFLLGFSSCFEPPGAPKDQPYYYDSTQTGERLNVVWAVERDSVERSWYSTRPFMFEDKMVFAYDSRLHCVVKATGGTVWIAKTESSIGAYTPQCVAELISDGNGGIIYITRDFIQCVALADGTTKWRVDAEKSASFTIYADNNSCSATRLFIGYRGRFDNQHKDQAIMAVDKSTGAIA